MEEMTSAEMNPVSQSPCPELLWEGRMPPGEACFLPSFAGMRTRGGRVSFDYDIESDVEVNLIVQAANFFNARNWIDITRLGVELATCQSLSLIKDYKIRGILLFDDCDLGGCISHSIPTEFVRLQLGVPASGNDMGKVGACGKIYVRWLKT